MEFKKNLNTLIRENNGKYNAVDVCVDWFYSTLKDKKDKQVEYHPINKPFQIGKIYKFKYQPINKDLDFYDKFPIVFSLGRRKTSNGVVDIGINFNFLPYNVKIFFFTKMDSIFSSFIKNQNINKFTKLNAIEQKPLPFKFEMIEHIFKNLGFEYAIRSYLPFKRKDTAVISYENWNRVMLIEEPKLIGITQRRVVADYSKYLNEKVKINKNNKPSNKK